MTRNMTPDYSVTLQDTQGRTIQLFINGACIDEAVATGVAAWEARENVEGNAFANAIARGEIGEDAWLI
jgi:hypothetical protein